MDILKICKCLSDKNRLEIVRLLSERKYCVRALSQQLGISESRVSQHIRLLKEAGLITAGDKNGYNIHYAVDRQCLEQRSDYLKKMADTVQKDRWCGGCRKEKQ